MQGNFKKTAGLFLAAVLLIGSLAGCTTSDQKQTENLTETKTVSVTEKTDKETEREEEGKEQEQIVVTDQAGREVALEGPAEKIVSSYYISTALLIALGCEDALQGIEMKGETRGLYQLAAPGLLELPAVGSGKGINVEETAALSPDVVILPLRLQDSVRAFEELNIPVVVVNPETQEDFEGCVELLAKVTGTEERGQTLLDYCQNKMAEVTELTAGLERPTVYLASGSDYLSTCTSKMYQNDLIAMAGGKNVSESLEEGYWQTISPEQLLEWNPEYIFSVQDADYPLEDILQDEALAQVQAVKEGKVLAFPSEIEAWDYPTPSSVLGVLWLTYQLHPEVYTKEAYVEEAKAFYQTFFEISVTEEQLGL